MAVVLSERMSEELTVMLAVIMSPVVTSLSQVGRTRLQAPSQRLESRRVARAKRRRSLYPCRWFGDGRKEHEDK